MEERNTDLMRRLGLWVWVLGLVVAGSAVLLVAGSRVGEHQASSFGQAYREFQASWGGAIDISPPQFSLVHRFTVQEPNAILQDWVEVEKTETTSVLPQEVRLHTRLAFREQQRGWLSFRTFEADSRDRYVVSNPSGRAGSLRVELQQPPGASILHGYTIVLPGLEDEPLRPAIGQPFTLLEVLEPGQSAEIEIRYSTKGMDRWRFLLSDWQDQVLPSFEALVEIDTPRFRLWRFGIPHTIERRDDGATVTFAVEDFTTNQDLGVSFQAVRQTMDRVQQAVLAAPVSLVLLLALVGVFARRSNRRFLAVHALFLTVFQVFFFLFVTYLVRFFGPAASIALAACITVIMFLASFPWLLGRRLAFTVALPSLLVLSAGHSLLFLLPMFRGLAFLGLVFLVCLVLMVVVSRLERPDPVPGDAR